MPQEGREELGHRRKEEEVILRQLHIVAEIQRWSHEVLQKSSAHFNGMPPCPFAKKAWLDRRVQVDFGGKDAVLKHAKDWDDSLDLLIVVTEDWKWGDIDEWCEGENDKLSDDDLTLMAFDPNAKGQDTGQPEEEATDWEPIVEEPYGMIFLQRLSKVNAASESLERSGYYKNCTAEFLEYVTNRRERQHNARTQEEDVEEGQQQDASCHP